jgi:hypothetical protein
MSVVSEPEPELKPEKREFGELANRVFRFDRVTSLMLSMILFIGILVAWLAIAWLSTIQWKQTNEAVEVKLMEVAEWGDGEEGVAGNEPELGEGMRGAEEQILAEDVPVTDFADPAELASDVISAIQDNPTDFLEPVPQGGSPGIGKGGRPGGTGKRGSGDGGSTAPRSLRWSINYTASQTIDSYARLLDFFGIEIGVMRGGERMTYVSGFSKGTPIVKKGGSNEDRLYFVWKDAGRRQADQKLLDKAKVSTANAVVVQFFPTQLEEQLASLEKSFKGRDAKDIRQTRFGVRRAGDSLEFYVIDQSYVR